MDRLVRRRQSLELLGLLVLERERWLRREELIEALWPECPGGGTGHSYNEGRTDTRRRRL